MSEESKTDTPAAAETEPASTAPAHRLRRARVKAGLSLGQVVGYPALEPGFDRQHLLDLEAGAAPTPGELSVLAELYNVSEEWLIGGDGNKVDTGQIKGFERLSRGAAADITETLESLRRPTREE